MNKVINQSNFSSLLLMWGRGKQSHAACYLFYWKLLIMYLYFFFSTRRRDIYSQGPFELFPSIFMFQSKI